MSQKHEIRKWLRTPTPELVLRTLRGQIDWSGALFSPGCQIEISGLPAAVNEHYRGVSPAEAWTGLALLANWAPTSFEINGIHCASVESFYHSLKFPEGSTERVRVAALPGPEAQHRTSHRRHRTLEFGGIIVNVDSPEHAAIISEAAVEKLERHPSVREALISTVGKELTFPDGVANRNVLARAVPLAFMIERLRRT